MRSTCPPPRSQHSSQATSTNTSDRVNWQESLLVREVRLLGGAPFGAVHIALGSGMRTCSSCSGHSNPQRLMSPARGYAAGRRFQKSPRAFLARAHPSSQALLEWAPLGGRVTWRRLPSRWRSRGGRRGLELWHPVRKLMAQVRSPASRSPPHLTHMAGGDGCARLHAAQGAGRR